MVAVTDNSVAIRWRARFLRGAGIIAAGYLASLSFGKWVLIAAIAGVVGGTVADVYGARKRAGSSSE